MNYFTRYTAVSVVVAALTAGVLELSLFGIGATSRAAACPYCHTDVGRQVSAGIFNDQFVENTLLTLLPLAVLMGIVAVIHFGLPRPWERVELRRRPILLRSDHASGRASRDSPPARPLE